MVYDCFTFFNELDMLEIRLNTLAEVVDKFVLVEMAYTFQRKPKPLYFEENKERFKNFSDKIIHIKILDIPEIIPSKLCSNANTWQLECYQRDCIMQGLKDAKEDDIIMLSDVDEIPSPKAVEKYKKNGDGITVFEQKMMYYFINNINVKTPVWENGTRIARFSDLKNPGDIPTRERIYWEYSKKGSCNYFRYCLGKRVKNAGWHFSYCGGVDAIIQKRKSFSEIYLNTEKNMSRTEILKKIYIGKDILDRKGFCYKSLRIDSNFPKYIVNNKDKYPDLILKQNILQKIQNKFVIFECNLYLAKESFTRNVIKFEKKIRKILSPCKKLVLKIFGI